MEWHYTTNDQQLGPVDDTAIAGLIKSGTITKTTKVWSDGMTDWEEAGQSPLAEHFAGAGQSLPCPPLSPLPLHLLHLHYQMLMGGIGTARWFIPLIRQNPRTTHGGHGFARAYLQ